MEKQEHPFSWKALIRIVGMALIVYLLWKASAIFAVILLSLVFAAALYPIAKKMSRVLPLVVSIVLVMLLVLIPFIAIIVVTMFALSDQLPQVLALISSIPVKLHLAPVTYSLQFNIIPYIQTHAEYFLNSSGSIFYAVISVISVLFLTFYFMFDFERLSVLFLGLFPHEERTNIRELFANITEVVGQYMRGNLIISVICGIIIFTGLTLLHVPFALPIAIFTAIIDLLPFIGPMLAVIPPFILGFAISPLTGILVLALYAAYQQAENVLIGPAIYNKTLNISSALIFLAIVVGGGIFGILGAFLALPVAASIPVIIKYRESYLKRHVK